jgi:hypothetical protein
MRIAGGHIEDELPSVDLLEFSVACDGHSVGASSQDSGELLARAPQYCHHRMHREHATRHRPLRSRGRRQHRQPHGERNPRLLAAHASAATVPGHPARRDWAMMRERHSDRRGCDV